jgi:hypothetical protein
MRSAVLTRNVTGDNGSFGKMILDDGTSFETLELRWENNEQDFSCIQPGTYTCSVSFSPHFQRDLYHVLDVPNRSSILIHPANWAGDKRLGLRCDLLGCIALGSDQEVLGGQMGIVNSTKSLAAFMANLSNEDFQLIIVNAFPEA